MKSIKNTEGHFGLISIFLHWFMALLIIIMLILGFSIASLPDVGFDVLKGQLIFTHKELGVLVLTLVAFRLIWRIFNVVPALSSRIPAWQKFLARASHIALYGFMFAIPITGWCMSSAAGFSVTYFGLFNLPNLISPNVHQAHLFLEIHKWLAFGLIATLVIHVGAALMHHFIDKDDTLRKMLP